MEKTGPGTYSCGLCGVEFASKRGPRAPGAQVFCSPEHRREGQRRSSGRPFTKTQYQRTHVCAYSECAQEFTATHPATVYCTSKCRYSARRARLAGRYEANGITGMTYHQMNAGGMKDKLLETQDKCAICERDLTGLRPQQIHLDHNHTSMIVRELLCFNCNSGLGNFKDNVEVLERAIAYLTKHREALVS